MDWQEYYASKHMTAADAVALVPRGKNIFIGSGAAEPVKLVEELVAQSLRFADNTIVHIMTLGPAPYVEPEHADRFRHNAFFIGPNVREAVHEGRADYTPIFLSQVPSMIRSRRVPVDVAFIQTSPPDSFGFVNLGVSVDVVLSAVESASLVIAEINPEMPVIHGAGFVPMDQIDGWVLGENTLPDLPREPLNEISLEIGRNVASLVDDGSTLQVGIGQIPDACLKALEDKKDLGVWSEMFSDGVIDLIENGNITGRYKTIHPHKVSASFAFGSNHLYEFVDRNPTFTFHPSDYINDPTRVARQHKMVAINGALQIDLTGQVCADSIGTKFYSGIGGQVDFIRGASMSPGGKPILALPSTAKDGQVSRIVASLDPGAGVVTSRGDVEYVVTEYGVADLQGRSIRDRAMALISIAHPSYRAELLDAGKERHYVFPDQITSELGYPRKYEKKIEIEGAPACAHAPHPHDGRGDDEPPVLQPLGCHGLQALAPCPQTAVAPGHLAPAGGGLRAEHGRGDRGRTRRRGIDDHRGGPIPHGSRHQLRRDGLRDSRRLAGTRPGNHATATSHPHRARKRYRGIYRRSAGRKSGHAARVPQVGPRDPKPAQRRRLQPGHGSVVGEAEAQITAQEEAKSKAQAVSRARRGDGAVA